MAIDKKIQYAIQGGGPNYLGKQKEVKAPIKWKSSPTHPEAHLAYITDKEQDLLIKKNLYGSLKGKPNRGPAGIVSLQGDLGGYQGGASQGTRGGSGGGTGPTTGGGSPAQQAKDKRMKDILTGKVTTGQTVAVSERTRRGAVPEYVYGPDGKPKYVGSAYKSPGQTGGWLSRLFGGQNKYGYAGTSGTGSGKFFDRKSSIKFNPATGRYESEDEEVGDIKPGYGGRILGGLAGLVTGIPFVGGAIGSAIDKGKGMFGKKPRDMSKFNDLGLTKPEDRKVYIPEGSDMPMARIDRWTNPINNTQILPQKKPINVGAGNFTSNLNDPSNMAYGMQMSNDQMTSMNNLIKQNVNTPFRPTDAMTGNYNTGAIPNRNRSNFNQFTGEWMSDGGRAGYQGGELVTDESMTEATPAGMMQENVEEVQGEPSREQLEALAMEIFQLPLEELNEEQLMVVYQAAMEQQPREEMMQEEDIQFAAPRQPMEEDIQQKDIQYAAQGGLAGLL